MKYEVKVELLQKIIEKQDEYIEHLKKCVFDDQIIHTVIPERKINELKYQLAEQQSTPVKSTIERKDFFESQMEDEPDRETLRKELIKYEKFCGTYFDDSDQLIDNYLTQKNKT